MIRPDFRHVLPHVAKEARVTGLGVRLDRHARDRQSLVSGLDDGLHAITESSHRVEAEQRLARVGAKPARRVREVYPGHLTDDPAADALQDLLQWREVLNGVRLPIGNHDVRSALDDGLHKFGNHLAGVLIVPVRVHQNVCAHFERFVDPVAE